jgi:hypothetical protein
LFLKSILESRFRFISITRVSKYGVYRPGLRFVESNLDSSLSCTVSWAPSRFREGVKMWVYEVKYPV